MKAAMGREFRHPLLIEDRPIRSSGRDVTVQIRGHVTVQIEAPGLCRTGIARV
jgi:hypothetical protein